MINIIHLFFLYNEISINPTRVTVPPIKILDVIFSEKIKKARIVAIIGSPRGNAAAIVGDTYFIE